MFRRKPVIVDGPQNFAAIMKMIDATMCRVEYSIDGRINWANENFLALTGYALEDLADQTRDILDASDGGAGPTGPWDAIENGGSYSGPLFLRGKDGAGIWMTTTIAPVFDHEGNLARFMQLSRDITARKTALDRISQALAALAQGRLDTRLSLPPEADFGALDQSFNNAMEALEQAFGRTLATLDYLNDDARETVLRTHRTSQDIREQVRGCQEASDAVKAVREAMQAVSGTVQDNLEEVERGVAQAREGATEMQIASESAHSMREQAEAMIEINRLIDSVSFQTSLLALNAGIEAARAGSAGAGFSVVAAEIRGLAQRAAEASRDIAERISGLSDHVGQVVGSVEKGDNHLKALLSRLEGIAGGVGSMTELAASQTTLLDRAGGEIASMAKGLSDAADRADNQTELSKEAGKRLEGVTRDIRGMVGQFRTSATGDRKAG